MKMAHPGSLSRSSVIQKHNLSKLFRLQMSKNLKKEKNKKT